MLSIIIESEGTAMGDIVFIVFIAIIVITCISDFFTNKY